MKLPLFATSATSTPCSFAMNPRKENITTPANIDVHEFTVQIISASLKYLFHFFELKNSIIFFFYLTKFFDKTNLVYIIVIFIIAS